MPSAPELSVPCDAEPEPAVQVLAAHRLCAGALLVEVASLEQVVTLTRRCQQVSPPWLTEVVPAARSVLVRWCAGTSPQREWARAEAWVRARAAAVATSSGMASPPREVRVEVVYDGPDLAEVAQLTQLSSEQVIERHAAARYQAAFGGFAPGFVYLTGLDHALQVPRRERPRASVAAGSVAIADEWAAVYPSSSPGGWRLLGRTEALLWDADRTPPALMTPGDVVRFVAVREHVRGGADVAAPPMALDAARRGDVASLTVVEPGPLTLVQDGGRMGWAAVGVPTAGAADAVSAARALRLVGAHPDAAVLEVMLGGLRVRAEHALWVAVTGAVREVRVHGRGGTRREGMEVALRLRPGEELEVTATAPQGTPTWGVRTYVAVRGGVTVEPVLGSRSADVLSGVGPRPLCAGDVVPVGAAAMGPPVTHQVAVRRGWECPTVTLAVVPGPQVSWLSDPAELAVPWRVSTHSNRVGVRLEGARVRRRAGEIPPQGVVPGAVQVPPSGEPVVFGPDHPMTGGYPVVAVVDLRALGVMGQLRPGQGVRLRWTMPG